MGERFVHRASLVGQAVEDLSYEPLAPGRFTAELVGTGLRPQYKDGGWFVFSDLPPGGGVLRLSGERLQPQSFAVILPFPPLRLDRPGDNELVVIAATVETVQRAGGDELRITFDPVVLPRRIRTGARVLATGFATRLAADLETGTVLSARLESIAGLNPGAVVRIVRERSVRLKLDPYATVPSGLCRITGRVTLPAGVSTATVRLARLDGNAVTVQDVAGAGIATAQLSGRERVIGTAADIAVSTDERGIYHLYFPDALFPADATLEALREGQPPASRTVATQKGERKIVDFP
jgi:hypothetical protein